jgi:hypothetical protein
MTIIKENGGERRANDFYETPLAFAATVMYNIPCHPGVVETALDPGMGNGVWGKALRPWNYQAEITGVELAPQLCGWVNEMSKTYDALHHIDFLEWETDKKFDLIMGNPPFKLIHEFVDKSLGLLEKKGQLVFLMRLAMLESQKRYKTWWTHSPIKKVMVSPKRISFTGDGRSDDTAYAVFVWQEGFDGQPQLDWMWWDYDNIPLPVTMTGTPDADPNYPDWHYMKIDSGEG